MARKEGVVVSTGSKDNNDIAISNDIESSLSPDQGESSSNQNKPTLTWKERISSNKWCQGLGTLVFFAMLFVIGKFASSGQKGGSSSFVIDGQQLNPSHPDYKGGNGRSLEQLSVLDLNIDLGLQEDIGWKYDGHQVCNALRPELLGNGRCNRSYNTEACQWDHGDCLEFNELYPDCDAYKPYAVGDGRCHEEFNVPECGWDGGDCPDRPLPSF